jgi:hypothetical protein
MINAALFFAAILGSDKPLVSIEFRPGVVTPVLNVAINGSRYDFLSDADALSGNITTFPANTPVITDKGLRGSSAYTVHRNSTVAGSTTFASAGTYCCYVQNGGGTVTVSGASTGNGAAMLGTPVVFTTASAGMSVTFTPDGEINRMQVNSGDRPFPLIPTTVSLPFTSVNEQLSGGLTLTASDKIKSVLNSGTGTVIIEFYCEQAPSTSFVSLLRTDGSNAQLAYLDYNGKITATDGTNYSSTVSTDTPTASKQLVKISWKNSVFTITVNNKYATSKAYDGSWDVSSILYFLRSGLSSALSTMYIKSIKMYKKAM